MHSTRFNIHTNLVPRFILSIVLLLVHFLVQQGMGIPSKNTTDAHSMHNNILEISK